MEILDQATDQKAITRPWLRSYPEGVPAEIDPGVYRSVVDLFEQSIAQYRERNAYVCMDKFLTYDQLDILSRRTAAWLQSKGLKPGARVAVMMPNTLQYPISILGILRAGYVVVNVNPLYTPRELEHQLKDSGAEAIIILENFAHILEQVLDHTPVRHIVVASLGDLLGFPKGLIVNLVVRKVKKMVPAWKLPNAKRFNDMLAEGEHATLTPVDVQSEDPAFLQYTGGTTGVSKGATLTHRNIVANVLQGSAWAEPALRKPPPIDQFTIVCALPLYHIFALTVCCLFGTQRGALVVLITNPRDIPGFLKELRKVKFHSMPAVNTLYNAMLNHPDFGTVDWSNLHMVSGGGMAVQQAVADRWKAATGTTITQGYGLSETSPVATAEPSDATTFGGTVGLAMPSTDIAIRDDDGKDLPIGQPGEICIRGPQVMKGYWNRPDETAKAMYPDGFFKSGDIGVMDERGYLKIVDRKKDMILVSGFNVYPNEVEEVIAMHPGVLEVAAVGVPDAHSGEAVKIFVVRKDPALTETELLEFARGQLTGYKMPRQVEFRADLPKTNVGKILRRELRESGAK